MLSMTTASLLTPGTARRVVLVPASGPRRGDDQLRRFRLARLRLEGAGSGRPTPPPRSPER